MAKLVSSESMIALLQSFTAVLDEFGVSLGRAKRAAVCAAEGLMIVSASFFYQVKSVFDQGTGGPCFETGLGCERGGHH